MHAGVVPALMVAYSEADAVEGLDVDKYHFDKFSMRHNVDTVLRELWKDERCLMDLMAMAAPEHPQCAPSAPPPVSTPHIDPSGTRCHTTTGRFASSVSLGSRARFRTSAAPRLQFWFRTCLQCLF